MTYPNPDWKPEAGKPAMMRRSKSLIMDLCLTSNGVLYSPDINIWWYLDGELMTFGDVVRARHAVPPGAGDLVEPSPDVLREYNIDANGNSVVQFEFKGNLYERRRADSNSGSQFTTYITPLGPVKFDQALVDVMLPPYSQLVPEDGDFERAKKPTPVDPRWFQLFAQAIGGKSTLIDASQVVSGALEIADLAFAEVSKREGR